MVHYLIEKGYIPLDKSWMNRVGVLDLLHGYNDAVEFLRQQKNLSDDLQALHHSLFAWETGEPIDVGESATLYRFLQFAAWKQGVGKKFIRRGSLLQRKICDDPSIISYTQRQLLQLDGGTTQWASAAVLSGDRERIDNPPPKLKLTYEAVDHWNEQRAKGQSWTPRYDETILRQAVAYLELLKNGKTEFVPQHSEDYCFARAFGFITEEEGRRRWPQLEGHESNRFKEMETILYNAERGIEIDSTDHRPVQDYVMLQKISGREIKVKHPSAINKSWPQFWTFIQDSSSLLNNL